MDKKHEKIKDSNLFYCFVNIAGECNLFTFYIVPSRVVAKYVADQHKHYMKKHPGNKNTDTRVFRIGLETKGYKIRTPIYKKYKNKWGVK